MPKRPRKPLFQSVPTADRVGRRTAPCLDGSFLSVLLLVSASQGHPAAMRFEHFVEIVDGAQPIVEHCFPNDDDQDRRF